MRAKVKLTAKALPATENTRTSAVLSPVSATAQAMITALIAVQHSNGRLGMR